MKKIGSYIFFLGVLAMVLNFLNMVPRVLAWIYAWGETTAWILMGVITAVGGIMYLLGKRQVNA